MNKFVALLRREVWEHPALYVGPLGANLFVAISMLLLIARGIDSEEQLRMLAEGLEISGDAAFGAIRNLIFSSPAALVLAVTTFVGYFYFLDCLYAERKDRSILFFKSLPVTDMETVLSKLVCGALLLPGLSFAAFVVTQLLVLIVASVAFLIVGASLGGLWPAEALLSGWALALYWLLSSVLWYAPFIGFLIFVSAWARKAVFLWSLTPWFAVQAEFLITGQSYLGRLLFGRLGGYFPAAFQFQLSGERVVNGPRSLAETSFSFVELADPLGFLMRPALWTGFALTAVLVTAAIYLRRYRDDS